MYLIRSMVYYAWATGGVEIDHAYWGSALILTSSQGILCWVRWFDVRDLLKTPTDIQV